MNTWEQHMTHLTEADGEAMFALQQRVLAQLPSPRWYYPSKVEEFASHAALGHAWGLRVEGCLIALNIAVPSWESDHGYAACVGRDERSSLDFQDMMVNPDFRRQGIHSFFLTLQERRAREQGMTAMYATVDPDNLPSLRAFEKAGFVILQQQSAYDGRPRCYLRKGLV